MASLSKEELLFMAQACEEAERHEDMLFYMKQLILKTPENEPILEERNLLSVAYKNFIGAKRTSWRAACSLNQKEILRGNSFANHITEQLKTIEKEIKDVCEDCQSFIEDNIIKICKTAQGKVFFRKMKGDYYRYLAELFVDNEKTEIAEKGLSAYEEATEIAETELKTTDPLRLGLALNFSVFYYEILNNGARGMEISRKAFDDAIQEIDQLEEEEYKDSTTIMQLLRDGLTLWWAEPEEEKPEQAEQSN